MFSYSALVSFQLAWSLVVAIPLPIGQAMISPYYPGMMTVPMYSVPQAVMYQKSMVDGGGYLGANNGFSGYASDNIARDVVRDQQQVVNQGAQGVNGNHFVMKGNEAGQGYQGNVAGANYNHGGDGYTGAQQNYDTSSKDGYGGFGNLGHRKGQKTTGFHKTYHNVESGKDSKFVDEDHDVAEGNFGKAFDNNAENKGWDQYEQGHKGAAFGDHVVNNAGGRGAMKAVAVHNTDLDTLNRNKYSNNRDLAYQQAHMQSNRNNNLGMGHAAVHGGASGSYYVGPHMG